MASFDFFKAAGLKVEEVVALAESEVRRIDSPLFQTLEQEMAELLGATVKKSASDAMVKKKRRVYIPYTVDQVKLYQLSTDYPEWEVVFTMADKCSAPLARTVFMMSTEKLFDLSGSDRTAVVAYGCTLNPLITRNRKWAHVCMPLADSASYRDAMLDDRVMQFIISAADRNGKTVPLAEQYKSKNLGKMCCSRPADCEFSAKIGVMMLNRTPTSFRQVCAFMRQHNTDALYFAVPWNKAMETGIDGPFPELDAHVFHSTEHIDIAFKNAQDLDVRFTRSSYLELITKTVFSIGDRTYMKEHVDYVNGMAFYRIIAVERRFDEPPPVYRSWLSPAYRDYYSVKAFVPKNEYVDLRKHTAYRELLFDVPKKLLDDLLTFGMSLDAKDNTPIAYRRKLRSLTSGILLHSTIVRPNYELSVAEFKALAAVAFTHVFMRRFVTGETVKQLLASVKRGFDLRHAGAVRVFIASVCRLAFIAHEYTIDAFLTRLNEYWRAIWQRNVPVGSFNQTVGFKEYVPEKTNPWITTNFQSVFELMKPTGFNPHLPGASHLSFLYSQRVVAMPPTFTPILSAADQTRLEADLADAMGIWDESTAVMTTQTVSSRPNTQSDVVESLTSSIVRDFGMHREAGDHTLKSVIPLYQRHPPEIVHAGISDSPIYDLQYVLEHIFPGTTIINTDQFQGDISYGPMKLLARAYKLSVDISKLQPLRPEKIYRPKVGAHTMPNTKTTLQNTLYTVVKRNLNTPDAKDPAGVEQVWNQVWPAVCRVFFVDGAEQMLESMPYIGPTYENVKEWVSNIPDDKRLRLLEEDFSKDELDMVHNAMILKSKGKPLLSQEYGEASKPAASIAYDPTGKRVAVYSPLIGQKVKRQTAVLKPNVLIMQRKSPEQISEFLCRFDHRPDSAGRVRRYIEFDGSMFDKSQGLMAKSMHWNMLSKFRILPELLDMLRAAGSALEASAIQAGVRVVTPPERETGAADTLDANCDVSLAIYARFLDSIAHAIEFIMVMGDDVTIAIRGDVDLSAIESDVARIFNIVVKYTLSDYGYFCSGWICHLNDGLSRWVPDPIKRILDYCGQSNNENTDIHDQFQSHHDLCRGIEDVVVQEFLSLACPARYAHVSDKITGIVVKMACRLIATVKDDEGKFSNFRSSVLTKRNL